MKLLGWIIGLLVLVVAAVATYIVVNSGNLLKTAVETLGPEYLGVSVSLDAAEISLTDGSGELRGLVIGNPPGFDGPHAFSLGRIKLVIDPANLSGELISVKNIEVDVADLAIVARGPDTNFQAIMKNLEGPGSTDDSAGESADEESGPLLIIDRFAFTNARTSLDSNLLGELTVEVPDLHLADIGRKSQGVTIREALTQIFRPIVKASTEALARESLDELQKNAEQRVEEELEERLGTDLNSLKDRLKN